MNHPTQREYGGLGIVAKDILIALVCVALVCAAWCGTIVTAENIDRHERTRQIITNTASRLARHPPAGVKDGDVIETENRDAWGRPMVAVFEIWGSSISAAVTSKGYYEGRDCDDLTFAVMMTMVRG